MPKTSRTRNGTVELTVRTGRASPTSTRTRATGAGPSCGAGVEVGEDLVVRPALVRVAERAVLAHADSVPPAAAAGDEGRRGDGRDRRRRRARARRRGGRESEDETGESEECSPHGCGPPPLRLAEEISCSGLLYRTFKSCSRRFQPESPGQAVKVNDDSILPPRYEHPERIARGGMGEIYRAEDSHLARTVAVKVLSERYADNEATRGRFTREGLAAARLSKAPSTITIFDVGEHEGRPYIVMEYLAGGSLADRLTRDGSAAARPRARLAWSNRGGARRRACKRSRPPRRQARQPAAGRRRPGQGRRLRRRERGRPRVVHGSGHRRRNRRIPRARAGARRDGDPGQRPLRARGRRLRAADRRPAVRAGVLDRRGDGARERSDPARIRSQPGAAAPRSTTCLPAGSRSSPSTGSPRAPTSSRRFATRSTALRERRPSQP